MAASTVAASAPTAIGLLISAASSLPFLLTSRARVKVPDGAATATVWTSGRPALPSVVVVTVTPANWKISLTATPWPPDCSEFSCRVRSALIVIGRPTSETEPDTSPAMPVGVTMNAP